MAANQRNQLICRDQKCDRIYKSNQSQNHKSSQPIRISRCEKFFENAFVVSHFILLTSTRTELQQRSTRMNNPKPVACSRALTLSVMRFSFPAFSQGSSVVEQGTHKPLVGSSNLPPGTMPCHGFRFFADLWDDTTSARPLISKQGSRSIDVVIRIQQNGWDRIFSLSRANKSKLWKR